MELEGTSDIEGKTVRKAASEWSRWAARDIDGKTDRSNGREHMSQSRNAGIFSFETRSSPDSLAATLAVLPSISEIPFLVPTFLL